MNFQVRKQTRVTHSITITVLEAVRLGIEGIAKQIGEPIPKDAHIDVQVPGGGDYSNMSLEGDEVELVIAWSFTEGSTHGD